LTVLVKITNHESVGLDINKSGDSTCQIISGTDIKGVMNWLFKFYYIV